MSIEFKYVPLTFISTRVAIETQLKNTIIFKKVIEKYNNCIQLGDLIQSTQYGFTASAKDSGNHKLLRITDINNGTVNWPSVPLCDCDREKTYLLSKGDVLIARTGNNISYLVEENVPENVVFASYLIRLVCNTSKLLPDYLFLFLNSYAFWPQILLKQRGALLQNVNANLMRQLMIPMCSIHEQKEIISRTKTDLVESINDEVEKILGLYNTKVDIGTELTHQLHLLKKLRQQLLQDAVQGKLVKQSLKDEPASELLKEIKAEKEKLIAEKNPSTSLRARKEKVLPPIKPEEIPFEIPENWVWCRLGEICNYGSSPKAEPKSLNDNTWVLDLEDIEKETSNLLCKIRFNERNSLSTKSKFKKGEVLYSKLRPYLDKVIVADEDGVCTTEILPLKLYRNLNPFYIRFTLKRIDFLKYVNSVTKGMKMPRLGTTDGQMALIPLPPLNEQNRIVQKLDELMQYCNDLEASIKQSQQQNEKLLQQVLREALRGEGKEVANAI